MLIEKAVYLREHLEDSGTKSPTPKPRTWLTFAVLKTYGQFSFSLKPVFNVCFPWHRDRTNSKSSIIILTARSTKEPFADPGTCDVSAGCHMSFSLPQHTNWSFFQNAIAAPLI